MKDEYYTQSEVMALGFSKTMIKRLLPEPIILDNYHYRGGIIKLFKKSDVEEVMKTEQFAQMHENYMRRKAAGEAAARKAVETRKRNLKEYADNVISLIKITVYDDDTLIEKTLEAKRNYEEEKYDRRLDWQFYHWDLVRHEDLITWDFDPKYYSRERVDEETLARWVVNYIRHNLVDYNYIVRSMRGKTGRSEVLDYYRVEVLRKIAEVYPKYANECERQIKGSSGHFPTFSVY